jgi:hypothetical protein
VSTGWAMPALGHKRTLGVVQLMSALPAKADIRPAYSIASSPDCERKFALAICAIRPRQGVNLDRFVRRGTYQPSLSCCWIALLAWCEGAALGEQSP